MSGVMGGLGQRALGALGEGALGALGEGALGERVRAHAGQVMIKLGNGNEYAPPPCHLEVRQPQRHARAQHGLPQAVGLSATPLCLQSSMLRLLPGHRALPLCHPVSPRRRREHDHGPHPRRQLDD